MFWPRLRLLSYWLILIALLANILSFTTWSWQLMLAGTTLVLLANDWRKMAVFSWWVGGIFMAYTLPITQPVQFRPLLQLGLTVGIWSLAIVSLTALVMRLTGLVQLEQGQDNSGQDTSQNEGQP